jgi:hypothetical protein
MENNEPPRKKASIFEYEIVSSDSLDKLLKEMKEKLTENVTFEKIINSKTKEWTGKLRCSNEECTFREFNAFEQQSPNKIKYFNGKTIYNNVLISSLSQETPPRPSLFAENL